MNIFYLDHDPYLAAQMHCDQHVHKMLLETAQMLSTAHHEGSVWPVTGLYKSSHTNHPSNKWVRSGRAAYEWTYALFEALCDEYRFRYGKPHATELKLLDKLWVLPALGDAEWQEPPQCMPDTYKSPDTVQAYRAFYIHDKARFARWAKSRPMPEWFAAGSNQ